MIGKLILFAIIIGIRLAYTNMLEPLIKNSIMMTQFDPNSAYYVLIQSLPFIEKTYYGMVIILIFLIGMDVYKYFNEKKEKEHEEK